MNTDALLRERADVSYKQFTEKLIPNIPKESILGVRTPDIKKIAAQVGKNDIHGILSALPSGSHEDVILRGILIGRLKGEPEAIFGYVGNLLALVTNWAACDSLCANLKRFGEKYPGKMWEFIQPYLKSGKEYYARFGTVMLLTCYINQEYIESIFGLLDKIKHEGYYVKMAVAWTVSVCYKRFPEETLKYLGACGLDDFTYNKSLSKISELKSSDENTKRLLRSLKRQ